MARGLYQHVANAWKHIDESPEQKKRLIEWRREDSTVRIHHPTRVDKARALGYKAKPGFILVRQRILRGGRKKMKFTGGRKPKNASRVKTLAMNYRAVAEIRAVKKYINCEVLNSYLVGKDGMNFWFEVILIDRMHPVILADKQLSNIAMMKGRTHRGLTSAARKSRGLYGRGHGYEHMRPSVTADLKRREERKNKM